MEKCDMCGKMKRNVELQPSRNMLLFGPHPGSFYFNTSPHPTMEHRCPACERKVCNDVSKMIGNIGD